jgi:uncharacterized UPF0160 family protein
MNANKMLRSCGTHDGTFHADEVTACGLLMLVDLIDEDKIIRTRDPQLLDQCEYVCDVGGLYDPQNKLFDHHQVDYQGSFSSAGMILKYLANNEYLKQKEYDFLHHNLVMGIDAHDNGKDPLIPGYCSFSHIISNFTPIHYDSSSDEQNEAFHRALQFTYDYLKRLLERFKYTQSCRQIVMDCMAQYKDCLIFDQNIPWIESFFEMDGGKHPAKFVIMPSGSHWKLRGIPPSYQERMKVRLPQPKEWAGLLDEDLKRVSNIPGAIFCHKGRFISVWETREDALKALEYTLQHAKESKHDNDLRENHQGRAPGRKSI